MKKLTQVKLIISLFFLSTSFNVANANMIENPLQLSTESSLTRAFNAKIEDFWKENASSHYFLGSDNKNIHTISIVTGNTKAIVISQGRNESVLKYKEVAYDLNKQGYDIFLIDHRGQGFSERFGGDSHRGHVSLFQDYVDDLNQYVLSLELAQKYSQRYLLSHSMGGAISSLYLQQYQHPFQASVFFSPMLSINMGVLPNFLAKIITYTSSEVCSWFTNTACYVPGGGGYKEKSFTDNVLTHSEKRFYSSQFNFQQYPSTQLGEPTMRWLATSLSAMEQAVEHAHKINIPILLFQSGADKVVTSTGQNAFYKNVTYCKYNKFVVIDDAKHEILIEADEYRLPALNQTLQFFTQIEQGKLTCIK
ncbi:alpha/beta fold hydrolase [Psychromonas sp. KJ10-10]|uniref:alpha/beta fold hydrolase n=1 Tax=Psychromonas sp. KJ10-10 TaxID=3391823 RepID=UPI0039B58EB5